MKNMTYRLSLVLVTVPMALVSVACSGGEEGVTAENITLEECNDLFSEEAADDSTDADDDSEEMLEGDYDADGDEDEDDEAIEARCEELMTEDAASEEEAE